MPRATFTAVGIFVGVATIAGLVGCEAKSPRVRVRGTVTLDGKPLSSGAVQFHPAAGQFASGEIGPTGEFDLSTHAPGDGVLPGTYRVTVVANGPGAEPGREELLVPIKYTRSGTSDIEVTIFPNTAEPVAIELVSDAPPAVDPPAETPKPAP